MNKLQMAHEMALAIQGTKLIHDMELVSDMAWKYADAMQAEADKRKSKPELPSLQQTFIDGVEQPRYAPPCEEWRPDWSQAPEWAKYFAMDEDGEFYYFDESPFMAVHSWQPQPHGELDETFDHGYKGNWQDSLRERPQ